jgi:hypothetical protein
MDMPARRRFLLIISVCALPLLPLSAGAARRVTGVEPTAEQLAPVDPAWKAAGWRAVVPHAYVVTKLLPVRSAPDPKADIAFHLKGGVRVPVLEQQRDWWKIQWTGGRTGWARAGDLQPRASALVVDASTGRLLRRVAVKGQWGFKTDGKQLWSFANTGLTRTDLTGAPRLWSYPSTRELDADLPNEGVFSSDRRHLFFPARTANSWRLGQLDTATGKVRLLNTASGQLAGVIHIREGAVLARETEAAVIELGAPARKIPGSLLGVGPDGSLLLKRRDRVVRTDSRGKVLARARLPWGFQDAVVEAGGRGLAVCYAPHGISTSGFTRELRVKLLSASSLTEIARIKLATEDPRLYAVMRGPKGWIVVTHEGEISSQLTRYDRTGKAAGMWSVSSGYALDPRRARAFVVGEELIAVSLRTAAPRKLGAPWAKVIREGFLPKDPDGSGDIAPERSALELSPDGRTLIVTERLAGDPLG